MTSAKLCTHYQKYKAKEKICNMLRKRKNYNICDFPNNNHQKEDSEDLWYCLDCGNLGCSNFSDNSCISKHYETSNKKHKIAVSLDKLMIYCFDCDDDLESILDEYEEENQQKEKLQTFVDSMKQSLYKVLKNVIKTTNKAKKEKEIVQNQIQQQEETKENYSKENKKKQKDNPQSIFGLENIGNTCFFNSVLQCLNGTKELRNFYLNQQQNDFQDEFKIYEVDSDEDSKQDYTISGIEDELSYSTQSFSNNKKSKKNKSKNKKNKSHQQPQYEEPNYQQPSQGQPIKRINQQFQRLLLDGFIKGKKVINPSSLYKNVSVLFTRFMTFSQEDAQELLRCLLDSLSLGEERWFKINKSLEKKTKMKVKQTHIEQTFGGYLVNYLKCLECKEISRTFDFFMDLSVQIPGARQIVKEQIKKRRRRKSSNSYQEQQTQDNQKIEELKEELENEKNDNNGYQNDVYQFIDNEELKKTKIPDFNIKQDCLYEPSVYYQLDQQQQQETTIEQCLNEFASFELLNQQENYFKCDYCNDSKRALRKFYIYSPPKVLNIALKRFVFKENKGLQKNSKKVHFGEYLNIDPYTIIKGSQDEELDEQILTGDKQLFNYELYGVVQHQGSMDFGHYIAFVKHNINGTDKWFQFNDSIVTEISFKQVQNSDAYLLFYRRVE